LLIGKLLGSVRLRLGAADPIAGDQEIPIYERFYAGGINSVRGYGRWRVGPLIDDEPVGGRTLVETSVELRHPLPLTDMFDGVVFLDSGQVSLDSWDFPFDDLQYGTGVGVRVKTPIGPLGVDFGVPIDPPPEDQPWQIHVSLGAPF